MTYRDIIEYSKKYSGALSLDRIISKKRRKHISIVLFIIVVALLSYIILNRSGIYSVQEVNETLFVFWLQFLTSIWLVFMVLRWFYNSYYFKDIDISLNEFGISNDNNLISYETADIFWKPDSDDITEIFLKSLYGKIIWQRLGLPEKELVPFLKRKQGKVNLYSIEINKTDSLGNTKKILLKDIAEFIYESDLEFKDFLLKLEIQKDDFLGSAVWMDRIFQKARSAKRYWGRDYLGKIPGIGKDWSYGKAFALMKYAYDFEFDPVYISYEDKSEDGKDGVEALERVLARESSANAMLVGDFEEGLKVVLAALAKKIDKGTVLTPIEHKRIFMLNSESLVSATKSKTVFEQEFVKVLNSAIDAGNIILVIDNLPSFIESTHSLGVNLSDLLAPFLNSTKIQIIALSNRDRYHSTLETDTELIQGFEKIIVNEKERNALLKVLEDKALLLESEEKVFFTYQAIKEIADAAYRYFTFGVVEDKAKDVLVEVIPYVKSKRKKIIERADVSELVYQKTGVPQGEVSGGEKQKLLNLEKILHERIIGQDEAVSVISQAIRRSRAGVRDNNKPIGSFLFLGPTGVGKTETTKALANVFFGGESKIIRFDMSEFSGFDAVGRLIGSSDGSKNGALSSAIRDKGYGVVLLDEFEKATEEVHDLFLQILDEGYFTDTAGKKVNMRNTIIIATSNAGSDIIWQIIEKDGNLFGKKDDIVNKIIEKRTFKPELINRFDGVVLFHPLNKEHTGKIAKLILDKFASELNNKGIEFKVNEVSVEMLLKFGYDPKFGARPMKRALQEQVEEPIAKKILSGDIKSGSVIEFKKNGDGFFLEILSR